MEITATPAQQLTLTLSLNEKEAMVIRGILGACAGIGGPREMVNRIDRVLENLGVDCALMNVHDSIDMPSDWDAVESDVI